MTDRSDNPFYSWQRVPASVVEAERELEAEREAGEGSGQQEDDGDDASAATKTTAYAKFAEEEQRLRDAEKALYRKKRQQKSTAADAHLTEAAVDDGFNAELAEVINEDAEEAVTDVNEPVAQVGVAGDGVKSEDVKSEVHKPDVESGDVKPDNSEPEVDEEEEWYEEQRAVDWEDLSLKTKVRSLGPS